MNELTLKLKQIMEVDAPSLCTSSPIRDFSRENNDKDVLTQAKSLKKKDGLRRIKKRVKKSKENSKRKKRSRKEVKFC